MIPSRVRHARVRATRAVPITVLGFAVAAACPPQPAIAQFGRSVGIATGPEVGAPRVLVLRSNADRGEAALIVFSPDGAGGWDRSATLTPAPPAAPYEGFSPSLAVAPSLVAAGAADADGVWAASVYEPQGDGWAATARVPFDAGAGDAGAAPPTVTMATLMGIMQPPARVVAVDRGASVMAAWAQGSEVVRLLEPSPDGAWRPAFDLAAPDSAGFGPVAALAAAGDRVAVGAPRRGGTGTVVVYRRDGSGGWTLEGELSHPDLRPGAMLGAALVLRDDELLVGAPGAGAVATFLAGEAGWRAVGLVRDPADGSEGSEGDGASDGSGAFGFALAAAADELWVGSPRAEEGRGAVQRFRRDDRAGEWTWVGTVRPGGGERAAFGAAVALADGLAVVGAPAAVGGTGRAAVFARENGGWGEASWVSGAPALESVTGGEVRCEDGNAAAFDCSGVDLQAFLTLEALGGGPGERVSDVWGWTDPETGREYALVGRTAGMVIVDVTAPSSPVVLGIVPANPSGARDIKTYGHHAFFTGDGAGDHGLVVFDLTRLRTPPPADDRPATYEPDARYTGITSAHNLILDPETGVAIPVGASGGGTTCGGGFHMVDVTTPLEPAFLGCYTDDVGLIAPGRSHDGQCAVYRGPDQRFRGRQVCFASNETALRILDITEPDSVREVAIATYPGVAYAHQGWLTEDHRYFFMNDELDELVGITDRTRTLIWDIAQLDDPVLVSEVLGPDGATDHNLFIRGDRMYQANYQAGVRILDISDPEAPVEIGRFDTTPYDGNPPGFGSGAWTAFPFLESGTVVVTSMYEGLFLLRPRRVIP